MFKSIFFTLVLLQILLYSSVSFALDAPRVAVGPAGEGKVRITLLDSGNAEGFNVYFNQAYSGTYRPEPGTTQFVFDGQLGAYCVVGFATIAGRQQFSPCSTSVILRNATLTPSAPVNFRATLYSTTVAELFWDASADGVSINRYELKRDGNVIANFDGRSFFESSLSADRRYDYTLVAIDNAGNRSAAAALTLITPATNNAGPPNNMGDNSPPTKPNNLRGTFYSNTAAEIFWDESYDNTGVARYEVVRNDTVVAELDARSYYDTRVYRALLYNYKVAAIDAHGNRSEAATLTLGGPANVTNELTLQLQSDRYNLNEGASDELQIPVTVNQSGTKQPVKLSLRAEHPSDASQFSYQFVPSELNANQTQAMLKVKLGVGMAAIDFHERQFNLRASNTSGATETQITFDVKPVVAPDVYLLVGQSNMEGSSEMYAKNTDPGGSDELNLRIKQLNVLPNSTSVFQHDWQFRDESTNTSSPRYIVAEDPLHEPRVPGRSIKEATFIGLGLSFAKSALPSTTQEIVLVPAAWSATGFCAGAQDGLSWNAEPTPEAFLGGTLLADRALTRLNLTLRETGGVFRGILWHQGEADSNNGNCARTYRENLTKLVRRFRTEARVDVRGEAARGSDAPVPLVVGSMSKGEEFGQFNSAKIIVDDVHRSISSYIPHAGFSNHDDLIPPDYPCGAGSCVHFGSRAYREIGDRYYRVLRDIIGR